MFYNIKFNDEEVIYVQIYNYLKNVIQNGMLPSESKLPSTRELATIMNVSRTTIMKVYELLEDNNLVYTIKGKGTFVCRVNIENKIEWEIDWKENITDYAKKAESLDIMKYEKLYKKGMISFKSIAPDEKLFDVEEVKRAFLNRMAVEGEKLLNYGYARGYKYFIEYIIKYMRDKGVSTNGKDVLITNGFTEGFDLVLSSVMKDGDSIICENPTHNTALKLMKLHNLNIIGIDINKDGINIEKLKDSLKNNNVKAAYLIPSYHNPTGMVMPFGKREAVYNILKEYNVPIIEDGFNEELQHSGSHIAPIAAISRDENSVIYIGSLSKILFPGIRIGWIFADKKLIDILESVKRSRNIHTSFLDQGILYEYMISGSFEKYVKKVKNIYRKKYELCKLLAEKYIPHKVILGDGGLYLFIELDNINGRELLNNCYKRNVIFTPGDIFSTNNKGENSIRIGFSRTSIEEIKIGMKIIGEEAKKLYKK